MIGNETSLAIRTLQDVLRHYALPEGAREAVLAMLRGEYERGYNAPWRQGDE